MQGNTTSSKFKIVTVVVVVVVVLFPLNSNLVNSYFFVSRI
jgi:hypothetical protein